MEEYLEYREKRKAAERLMGNNDAVGLSNLYAVYAQQERAALKNASNESKMNKLKPRTFKRASRVNKLESMQYESALTNTIRGYGPYTGHRG